ncbi:hypothetical protein SCP_0405940 [Sparassis crispa]|uniref:Reverse transcriptase domain-containing protein n=1 Tax=Sparassis crispa TaxID=139825 RepID=A0A401GJ94_9APHY|nr:hypothetical protein SCP_0405940 [Sparassis crispa]GBE82211.1 hypothetical protein SCP_0405940 [Sparassis crispa]
MKAPTEIPFQSWPTIPTCQSLCPSSPSSAKLKRRTPSSTLSLQTRSRKAAALAKTENNISNRETASLSLLSPVSEPAPLSHSPTPLPTRASLPSTPPVTSSECHMPSVSSSDTNTDSSSTPPDYRRSHAMANGTAASVEQDAPTKVPILLKGDITLAVMREYEDACKGYFEHKSVDAATQVRKIIAGLKYSCIKDWITGDCNRIQALSFNEFMHEFRSNYLEEDWEDDVHCELLSMSMTIGSFWDFAVKVQAKNSLLVGTASHLDEKKLRHQLEAGMTKHLAKKCSVEKVNKVLNFRKWLQDVKRVDEVIRTDLKEFEHIARENRNANRCMYPLSKPSRCGNTASATARYAPTKGGSTLGQSTGKCPPLKDTEHQFLYDNEGCLKCRRLFAGHISHDCPNGFPDLSTYKTITQEIVNKLKGQRKLTCTTTAISAATVKSDEERENSFLHPVAAVMGSSRMPIAAMPNNDSSILSEEGNSESLVSLLLSTVAPITMCTVVRNHPPTPVDAPFRVPHLVWHCAASGPAHSLPVTYNALIDDGSHTVLIRDDYVDHLQLHHRRLPIPEHIELAMEGNGQKIIIKLSEWVHLSVFDLILSWSAKSVNDYRTLNANTVLDSHPLPRVEDIIANCAKGKIWSKMDMTNSFFQTRVHPDDVHLMAVTTPLGLYEWLAMPMGLRNSPPIHQRCMTAALREYLGRFCHIYLDDIVIWSDSVEQHAEHVRLILAALRKARLYCNPKKCEFFVLTLDFLGHCISAKSVEAQTSKVDRILQWPVPRSASDVQSFLGLVRYIAAFLPKLADFTTVLTPLTTKESRRHFPEWMPTHQSAFDAIKALVISRECLTVIDHLNPGDNKIFLTCDSSDWHTGATLSFGPSWETARPIAFDSMQLKATEKNYPIHEKELLMIIRALKKWRSDLMPMPVFIYTDHRTLENFDTQHDLS